MITLDECEKIEQIARRMAWWARGTDPAKVRGYCMSGPWHAFYQTFLFPRKTLRDDLLDVLILRLRQLGYRAFLEIKPLKNGSGLYMYMRMEHIRSWVSNR